MCFQEDLAKETLLKQFKIVKNLTNTSHVQQFGNKVRQTNDEKTSDVELELTQNKTKAVSCCFFFSAQTLAHMKVIQFQGNHKAVSPPTSPVTLPPITNLDLTPSPDVPLAILKRRLMASNDIRTARGLLLEISTHLKVRSDFAVF